MIKRTLLLALGLVLAACTPKDVEVGPYTVSVIGKNVYHIQDYNHENPSGETFDADGKLTHFNNCSDIYLVVGAKEALLIDLSNPVTWAAITGIGDSATMRRMASADGMSGTAQRMMSQPRAASSRICASVASASDVRVFVMDCTDTGAPPPTATRPMRT